MGWTKTIKLEPVSEGIMEYKNHFADCLMEVGIFVRAPKPNASNNGNKDEDEGERVKEGEKRLSDNHGKATHSGWIVTSGGSNTQTWRRSNRMAFETPPLD